MIARLAAVIALALIGAERLAASDVVVRRVPNGGFKASAAVDSAGRLHLVYFKGEPSGGDAYYVTSKDGGATFAEPIRVNNQPGCVLGMSSSRGPRLALGKDGRVHAIWMGSSKAMPRAPLSPALPADSPFNGIPLLYANFDEAKGAFTEPRTLMTKTVALDGESAIVADQGGNVYVVWHAQTPEGKGEQDRGVWIARSGDNGVTFSEETNVLPEKTGVCPCCALTAQIAEDGSLAIVYRGATETVHRGMRLLHSQDRGQTFKLSTLDDWKLSMCPMSTAALIANGKGFFGAWENDGRLGFGKLPGAAFGQIAQSAPLKHPSLAINKDGSKILLTWTEGISFGKGGAVGWQLLKPNTAPASQPFGYAEGLPGHGNVAAVALADGTFAIIY